MSLNNIELHSDLLTKLYTSVLIDSRAKAQQEKPFKHLGSNKKKLLILVSKDNVAFLEEEELNFLTAVLAACKLNIADCAIVNVKTLEQPVTYQSFITHFESRFVLLFDITPDALDLPFHFPHFQLQQFSGSVYLSAPALKELESDKALKAKLWNSLKTLFSL